MDDAFWMRHCIQLAAKAKGHTSPNPMVGSVLVRNNVILAEGYHLAAGELHAERMALTGFTGDPQGATLYVNLEPCCHYGRTPPCTDIIIEKQIKRVVVGAVDPFPEVQGKGIETLKNAGIDVLVGVENERCKELNRFFYTSIQKNRPWITLKAAISLDGRIASAFGESKWITGPEARQKGHRLRVEHDAILVGIGTVLADDPQLNVRNIQNAPSPKPIILDSNLRCPPDAAVLRAGQKPLIFCSSDEACNSSLDAEIIKIDRRIGGLCLDTVLAELHQRDLRSVLIEGGGIVHGQFLDSDKVDAIELFMAPFVLGGGRSWLQDLNYRLNLAVRYNVIDTRPCGADIHISLRRSENV